MAKKMSEAIGKSLRNMSEKVITKITEGMTEDMIEPLGNLVKTLISLLDIDTQPEIKVKLFYARPRDYETMQPERYLCIGLRIVEPTDIKELENRLKRLKQ